MSIGKRLVEERARLGMTQAAFYRAVGTSKSMQFYFETDHSKPGAEYLIAADALGVDILYVLTGKRSRPLTSREQAHLTVMNKLPADARREVEQAGATAAQPKQVTKRPRKTG